MKGFQEGDRVRFIPDLVDSMRMCTPASSGPLPKIGTWGTVKKIQGIYGPSVHPDPLRSMVYVEWDSGVANGVSIRSAVKGKEVKA